MVLQNSVCGANNFKPHWKAVIVLVESNFRFRFWLFIQLLPLQSMVKKTEAEPENTLEKYYQ